MTVDPKHKYSNEAQRTKTLMMISNWKNPLVSMVYEKIFQIICTYQFYNPLNTQPPYVISRIDTILK